jgi:hypothetical protein
MMIHGRDIYSFKTIIMDKEKKNRSGSSNDSKSQKTSGNRGRTELPGAPAKSNRQTGGNKRKERDDSSGGAERNTTKKGSNSI